MAIMAISLSLVIPLTMQQIDSAQARAERNKVVQWVNQSRVRSYFANTPLLLQFNGSQLQLELADNTYQLSLEHIDFAEQDVTVFPEGRVHEGKVTASIRQSKWVLIIEQNETTWSNTD